MSQTYYYIGSHRAIVETDAGHLTVSTRDLSIFPVLLKHGCWEPWIQFQIQENVRQGMNVIDVGANYGYFILQLAKLVGQKGRITAFEPNADVFSILLSNVFMNFVSDRVSLMKTAVGRTPGEVIFSQNSNFANGWTEKIGVEPKQVSHRTWTDQIFKRSDAHDQSEGVHSVKEVSSFTQKGEFIFDKALYHLGSAFSQERVPQVMLDERFDGEEVHFILCDTEGFDSEVLHGARRVIQSNPNICLVFEWNNENSFTPELIESKKAILEFLAGEGFSLKYCEEYGHRQFPSADPKAYGDAWKPVSISDPNSILTLPSGNLTAKRFR